IKKPERTTDPCSGCRRSIGSLILIKAHRIGLATWAFWKVEQMLRTTGCTWHQDQFTLHPVLRALRTAQERLRGKRDFADNFQ
ncbi:MAG: hypothetical protein ACO20O_12120, partial [Pseudomonadales bacterium]